MKLTRDGAVWLILLLGGISGFLLEHYTLLQQAFPGISIAWHARIELFSMIAGVIGGYFRLSPLPLSHDHPLATNESDVALSPLNSKKPLAVFLLAAAIGAAAVLPACALHKQPPAGTYSAAGTKAFNADNLLRDLIAVSQTAINMNAQTGKTHLSDADTALVRDFALSAGAALNAYGTGGSTLVQVRDAYFALMRNLSVDGSTHTQLTALLMTIGVALNQVQ